MYMMRIKYCFKEVLIRAPVSNKDLVKIIPPILLVIMGVPRSLFLIYKEFIMIEVIVLLSLIILGLLWGVHMSLRNFA